MKMSDARGAGILHADLDSFYASVAQRDDPRLRGRPVAVGGGIVLAASYEAKRCGVRTAMPGRQARALCPDLIEVRADFDAYVAASKAVFRIFRDTTPQVQGISIDEAFLDVRGLHRIDVAPLAIGARLRERIRGEVGLPITVGVARTPFLAKVASKVAKPDGLLLVEPDGEDDFLHPLGVQQLWGVGPKTTARLAEFGIHTAGEVAELERRILVGILGQAAGGHLHAVVHGLTPDRVHPDKRRGSVGAQRAIGRGPHAWGEVEAALLGLVDRVCRRLRKAGRIAATVELRLRFEDYTRITRSHSLPHPTGSTALIADVATGLLTASRAAITERGITLVGVGVSGLAEDGMYQPQLQFGIDTAGLDHALDRVGERFGSSAITRASLMRRGEGWAAPQLEE